MPDYGAGYFCDTISCGYRWQDASDKNTGKHGHSGYRGCSNNFPQSDSIGRERRLFSKYRTGF